MIKLIDNSKSRNYYIDILKIISIILVIITHDTFFADKHHLIISVYFIDMAVPIFMIVSGINYAGSSRRNNRDIKRAYSIRNILSRLSIFLIPYTIVFGIVVLLLIIYKNAKYTFEMLALDYIMGGYGPGAYYTPIIVQFVLLAPILYYFIQKYGLKTLVIFFIINFVYEVSISIGMLGDAYYPRIILRYLFLLSVGIYIGLNDISFIAIRKFLIPSFLLGFVYLTYCNLMQPVIFTRWSNTSMISAFYSVPIVITVRQLISNEYINKHSYVAGLIELCASSTYQIYLVQMTYYYIGISRFISLPLCGRLAVSTIVCITVGIIFYIVFKYIYNLVRRYI